MTHLYEIFDDALLKQMLDERYVKRTAHPEGGAWILNYTARAQYDKVWNDVTLACRGLVIDDRGIVLARPFQKFFNLQERDVSGLDGEVVVTEKLDGSLGVLYPHTDGWRIATRGSFESAQALEGTRMFRDAHAQFEPNPAWTYMFEIIYPQNRIVVDYGDRRELVLLGAVEITTGCSVPLAEARRGWGGAVVETLPYGDVHAALAADAPSNTEGMVLHFVEHDVRVKLKHEEYVRLHRLVTGVSERRVWEVLSAGEQLDAWLESVPDELYRFVSSTRDRMHLQFAERLAALQALHAEVLSRLGEGFSRRELAEEVQKLKQRDPLAQLVFALHDGKPIAAALWDALRPAEHIPFFSGFEEE